MWIAMAADYETSGEVTAAPILLLGDSRLRQVFVPVSDFMDPAFVSNQRRLSACEWIWSRHLRSSDWRVTTLRCTQSRRWPKATRQCRNRLGQPIDHLDGILAVDRVLDDESLVMREVFEAQRAYFVSQVDYVIAV